MARGCLHHCQFRCKCWVSTRYDNINRHSLILDYRHLIKSHSALMCKLSLFSAAPRIERDPDQYDYTSVAGLAGLRASAHLRYCAEPSSNSLVTPIRAKPPLERRKTMVTMLADQIPEDDSEETSVDETAEEGTEAVEEESPQSNKVGSWNMF